MWFSYTGQLNVRHTCEHGDGLARYGWIRHDGSSYGQQQLVDGCKSCSRYRDDFLLHALSACTHA